MHSKTRPQKWFATIKIYRQCINLRQSKQEQLSACSKSLIEVKAVSDLAIFDSTEEVCAPNYKAWVAVRKPGGSYSSYFAHLETPFSNRKTNVLNMTVIFLDFQIYDSRKTCYL